MRNITNRFSRHVTAAGGVAAVTLGALLLANCSDSAPTGASAVANTDTARFELVCDQQGATQPTAQPSPGATPQASASTQEVPIFFDAACVSGTSTDTAEGGTDTTTTGQTVQFMEGGFGPIRITPDCANRTLNITVGEQEQVTQVSFNQDGTFNTQLRVNTQLQQDTQGTAACTTQVLANIEGTVSCPGVTVTNTDTGTTPSTEPIQVAMNAQWQFGAQGTQPTPTDTPTPAASPEATPEATPSPQASPSPEASPETETGGTEAGGAQCVLDANTCGFTTPVALSCGNAQ